MFNADDNDEVPTLLDEPLPGLTAQQHVVAQHVQTALIEAARLANRVFDKPSEVTVMQIFQTMMDRTAMQSDGAGNGYVH